MNTDINEIGDEIHHEHLGHIIQHDWYVRCEQVNNAVALEDATYRVIAKECGKDNEFSFTNLRNLMIWAGY